MSDIEFVNGLTVKQRNEKAPDYVLANGSINCEQMLEWLQGRTGWINWQAKMSKGGKPYVAVDTWKPNSDGQSDRPQRQAPSRADHNDYIVNGSGDKHADASNGFVDDEIPFAPIPLRRLW